SAGFHPELIHTAREVNERVVGHVAAKVLALLGERGRTPAQARILVLGVTFKENCPDLRNSRALDLVRGLGAAGARVDAVDPWADRCVRSRRRAPMTPSSWRWRMPSSATGTRRACARWDVPARWSTTSSRCGRARPWTRGCRRLRPGPRRGWLDSWAWSREEAR